MAYKKFLSELLHLSRIQMENYLKSVNKQKAIEELNIEWNKCPSETFKDGQINLNN